jgi:hypothetical protein
MIPSTAEYDSFGPWVLPVSSPDQVPPVFRAHPVDFARAHLVLKVPRDVLRRDVTPRSQLYDALLVLDEDGLEVLTRVGHRFAVQRIRRSDVAAVDTGTELLDGWLVVLGRDGSRVDVRFNGASLPRMTDLADRLLGWSDAPPSRGAEPLAQDAIGRQDAGLINAHNALPVQEHPRRVVAVYPQRTPDGQRRSWLQRLLRGPALLSGAVVSSDARHTIVVARRDWLHRSRTPDLSLRRVVLPSGWATASTAGHATLHDVVDLRVRLGAAELPLTVPADQVRAVASVFGGERR